jgi:hypothetical protein
MSNKPNNTTNSTNSVSSLGSSRSNNTLAKRLPFPKKLIKSLENFRDSLWQVQIGKSAITNLISLLNEYNEVIKTNNLRQIQPIIEQLAPIFTNSKGGVWNTYHKIGGLYNLNTYMQIRKIGTKYYLGNDEIDKETITFLLPSFTGNNNIKNKNLNNLNNVGKYKKPINEKLYTLMYNRGNRPENIRAILEEEKYNKNIINIFMNKLSRIHRTTASI